MRLWFLFLALSLSGCVTGPWMEKDSSSRTALEETLSSTVWAPTLREQKRAEQIAREYAPQTLGLARAHVAKMRTDFTGLKRSGSREILIQFYDPEVFQPQTNGRFAGIRGGFPRYFTITVNAGTGKVLRHYAERM